MQLRPGDMEDLMDALIATVYTHYIVVDIHFRNIFSRYSHFVFGYSSLDVLEPTKLEKFG